MKIRPSDRQPATPRFVADRTDFDVEKVLRVAQAIRDGRFTVDAEAIADKLLASEAELRGRSLH